jgi:pimeloyl-ACP methyl ester carboxylesterase
MWTVVFIGLAGILVIAGLLILFSLPGRPAPLQDESGATQAGSLSEKIWEDINGVQQGMIIKSRSLRNPVLLFLHGGPGMPEYFLTHQYPTGLEEYFTVVWWDQRGAGLSFSPNIAPETMTVEQIISDTLAVTNYLRSRFHEDKIYLMAHSGGSFYGIQAAARAPELYHAYIGMAQMVYQLKSETLAYPYMLEQFKANGNQRILKKLEAAAPTLAGPMPPEYAAVRDDAMHQLGIGTTRDMKSVLTGIFLPSWFHREFTLIEKVNLWRGKIFSMKLLRDTVFATDLTQQVRALKIPIYIFHGRYDYTCSYTLAREYFGQLRAPIKGFYTFDQSAHSPFFEEPGRVREIFLADVLAGANTLADVK